MDHCPAGVDEFVSAGIVAGDWLYGKVCHGQYCGRCYYDLTPPAAAFADNCDGHDWQHVFLSFLKWIKLVNLDTDAPF